MRIRFLTAGDASEWWRLRLEALEGDPAAFSASAEEHRSLSLDDVRKRIGDGTSEPFVIGAFDDERLAGIAGFYREKGLKSRHKGRIWGVYVTPTKRGTGIGRQLLKMLLKRARQIEGVEQILLSVSLSQKAAIALYQSLGFESWGCEPRALKIGHHFIDEQYMILKLNADSEKKQ
jgi:ribosomal protein S18 acetylase RimI-like enzyme